MEEKDILEQSPSPEGEEEAPMDAGTELDFDPMAVFNFLD